MSLDLNEFSGSRIRDICGSFLELLQASWRRMPAPQMVSACNSSGVPACWRSRICSRSRSRKQVRNVRTAATAAIGPISSRIGVIVAALADPLVPGTMFSSPLPGNVGGRNQLTALSVIANATRSRSCSPAEKPNVPTLPPAASTLAGYGVKRRTVPCLRTFVTGQHQSPRTVRGDDEDCLCLLHAVVERFHFRIVLNCGQRGFRVAHTRLHILHSGHRRTTGEDER
jgi:hypothetical protein